MPQVCLIQKFRGRRAKQRNHLREMGPTTVDVEFRIIPGKQVAPLIDVPDLRSEMSAYALMQPDQRGAALERGQVTYHATNVPNVNAV